MGSQYHLNLGMLQKCPRTADERSAAPPSSAGSHPLIPCCQPMRTIQDRGRRKWNRKGAMRKTRDWLPTSVHCLQFALTLVPSGELPL